MKRIHVTLFLALSFIALTLTSCKKDNAAFVGTYAGTTTQGTNQFSDVFKISAGSGSKDITVAEEPQPGLNLTGTVSGTTLTIPNQAVIISGGSSNVTGTGSISGNTLTFSLTILTGTATSLATFTGTK